MESVRIQEERAKNWIMNIKLEYSRCTIPRLTAKMVDKEYNKIREKEREEEKVMEEKVKLDIRRRKDAREEEEKSMTPRINLKINRRREGNWMKACSRR